jgi:hypothetical protein
MCSTAVPATDQLARVVREGQATGPRVMDAVLAAIALEQGAAQDVPVPLAGLEYPGDRLGEPGDIAASPSD